MASNSLRRMHMKMLYIQLITNEHLWLATNVWIEEITHVMHVIPWNGVTVVPRRNYIGMAIINIMSRIILKTRFITMASRKKHNEQELEQALLVHPPTPRRVIDDKSCSLPEVSVSDISKWQSDNTKNWDPKYNSREHLRWTSEFVSFTSNGEAVKLWTC